MSDSRCPGCGVALPAIDGPTHRYMESSPACWAAYGEVLVREYSDEDYYRAAHRLSVDTYAVQHPGVPSPQTIQSVCIHLIGLHGSLELQLPAKMVAAMITRAADSQRFEWLEPPKSLGTVTVADVLAAKSAGEQCELVRRWAQSAWEAWSPFHSLVRQWAQQLDPTSDGRRRAGGGRGESRGRK